MEWAIPATPEDEAMRNRSILLLSLRIFGFRLIILIER